jgi:hypothetical protein
MVLCEYVFEEAEKEAMRRLHDILVEMTAKISDEIIETAKEYES